MTTIKMYRFPRTSGDDYILVKDNLCVVHSAMLKNIWEDPNKVDWNKYSNQSFESYYGASKEEVLENSILLWEKEE